jgi:uncharacterized membrane protein YeaQ/YmgE (transglycosylase-associated protein family)
MIVLQLIVIVGCVLVGWLVPMAFKSERPFGLVGDILGATIVGVIYAFIVYQYLVPMVGMTGPLALFGSAAESIMVGAIALWIMRKIKS